MKVEQENVRRTSTSCNFCSRGEMNKESTYHLLTYPYEYVYTICREGSGLKAAICEDCANELISKLNEIKATHITNNH